MSSRPEHEAPPEIFYNFEEARKYTANSRIIEIQAVLSKRCIELLNIPEDEGPKFILDIGCGSGLSGEELSDLGHQWVGLDISPDMLDVACERECEGDLLLHDMGHGIGFRAGTFDGVISVSALQWLCNADKRCHNPRKRLSLFFSTLYSAMAHGARAVFQFYPETPAQMQMITNSAMKAGFTGGIVVDFPNSKRAKKIFLCLFAGVSARLPQGKTGEDDSEQHGISYTKADRRKKGKGKGRRAVKNKDWILAKKERRRRQHGSLDVRPNTKYTGRKRPTAF